MRALLAMFALCFSFPAFAMLSDPAQFPTESESIENEPPEDVETPNYEVIVLDQEDADSIGFKQLSIEDLVGPDGALEEYRGEYDVAGRLTRKPRALKRSCGAVRNGVASWYGPGFHGRKTASGERFNQGAMTAAHKTLPFNSLVRVCYQKRCTSVRINDAGPYHGNRVIDLSNAAARVIRMRGTGKVSLSVIRCGRSRS